MVQASAPVNPSPVRMYLMAFFSPTIRVNLCVPPSPGMSPKLISGRPKQALSVASTISQNSANQNPPPSAFPLTPAITGFLFLLNASISKCKGYTLAEYSQSKCPLANYLMSAPAQKIFCSSLTIAITCTASSAPSTRRASQSYRIITWLRQLRSWGLRREMQPVCPRQQMESLVNCGVDWEMCELRACSLFICCDYNRMCKNQVIFRICAAREWRLSR